MAGLWKNFKGKVVSNKLTFIGVSLLLLLTLMLVLVVVVLATSYLERFTTNRTELIDRDLRDIAGQFDTDEKYVLEKNIEEFLKPSREFHPLLLPRQYFVSLPSGSSKFIPRQPPRNCFIKLSNSFKVDTQGDKFPEKFCAYFAEPESVGKYLFATFSINDKEVIPLQRGDSTYAADGLKLTIQNSGRSNSWWIYFQQSSNVTTPGRYQITAFKETENGSLELDKRLEGWAFEQQNADNLKVINILTRLDFKSFIVDGDESWPPQNWRSTSIKISRNDKSRNSMSSYEYPFSGESFLSISSVSKSIFNSYANLELVLPKRVLKIQNNHIRQTSFLGSSFNDRLDILFNHNPILERSLQLQDTNITLKVTQPSIVVEKSLWQSLIYMIFVTLIFIITAIYLFVKVMRPIFVLARQARQMINNDSSALPYSELENEIGDLSRAFNELLDEREIQASKRANQEREARIKYEMDMKSRETTLQYIGHEIRSPLQSLGYIHKAGSPASRYIERMTRAINTLEDISGPDTLFSNRKLYLEVIELNDYLNGIAENCDPAQYPNVKYEGPDTSIYVEIDDTVLEDAITNILNNGHRHRDANTDIIIKLYADKEFAFINIFNKGQSIKDEDLNEIFSLGFTTKTKDTALQKGIGLHAVRQYISRLNGIVTAKNENFGVCFTIKLPLISKK